MSNLGLYTALDRLGIRYERTKVGDRYVYESMAENGYGLGGEQSGHIIFLRHATTGDGILTSLKIMELILDKKKSLHELCEDFTVYPQVLKNVRVLDKEKAEEIAAREMAARISQGDRNRTSLVLMKALVKEIEEASQSSTT